MPLVQPPSRPVQRVQMNSLDGWPAHLRLPFDRGQALVSFLFSAVNWCDLMAPREKKHSSSLLQDGSSGGDTSSQSSLTAFVMTQMSSSSERLSSISPSLAPNEIMSLAAAEGRWSCWVKRTGLSPATQILCPLFFPQRSLRERKRGGGGGIAFFLWKESYPRAQRKRLNSQWEQSAPAERSVSMGFPQAWHTLSVSVISVQGSPAHLTMTE